MILSRELEYDAYFLTPYDGGTGLTLIRDKHLSHAERRPLARIITVFPQAIDALTVFDHRAAFTGYVHDYGLIATEHPGGLRVTQGKDELVATFDDATDSPGSRGPSQLSRPGPCGARPERNRRRSPPKSPLGSPHRRRLRRASLQEADEEGTKARPETGKKR